MNEVRSTNAIDTTSNATASEDGERSLRLKEVAAEALLRHSSGLTPLGRQSLIRGHQRLNEAIPSVPHYRGRGVYGGGGRHRFFSRQARRAHSASWREWFRRKTGGQTPSRQRESQ